VRLSRLRVFLLPVCLFALVFVQQMIGQAATPGPVRAYFPFIGTSPPTSTATPTPITTPTPTATPVPASGYVHGTVGFDYSFPACGMPAPTTSSLGTRFSFAVVGVNDGRAFTLNPCLASEFQNAAAVVPLVSFYININAPIGSTAGNGLDGPRGHCASTDYGCQSYNYGYNAAQDAHTRAATTLGSSTVAGRVWWLDVEMANSWWGLDDHRCDSNCNDQVLQGAIDYVHQIGQMVGAYSISSMWTQSGPLQVATAMSGAQSALILWSQIAGGYLPGVPAWVSGAANLTTAPGKCSSTSFTGGAVWLAQVPSPNYYDEDYAC